MPTGSDRRAWSTVPPAVAARLVAARVLGPVRMVAARLVAARVLGPVRMVAARLVAARVLGSIRTVGSCLVLVVAAAALGLTLGVSPSVADPTGAPAVASARPKAGTASARGVTDPGGARTAPDSAPPRTSVASAPAGTTAGSISATTPPSPGPPAAATSPGATATDPDAQSTSLPGLGPLVSNGLGSPSCAGGAQKAQLSASARANCAASGVVASPAPIENYQFDIHIDTGLDTALGSGLGSVINAVAALAQDFLLTPLWMALVWLTNILVVALEWCYSINLLGSGRLGPIANGLDAMHRVMTTPWLATVLAVAAVTFLYNGLIRRRVVETLGHFALMLAMMIGGLAVVIDPGGTVGSVSQLANQASLGVLAASAAGDPSRPVGTLADDLDQVFAAAIGTPWCYLEFGNVGWCEDPGQLDPGLRTTAIQIVGLEKSSAAGPLAAGQAQQQAASIVDAKTNGALFLAFPANGQARNSINAGPLDPSLLSTLCGSIIATSCPAPTGAEAEFRTQQGTLARIGGLLLITVGELGMFGFLGFIALRLLGSALLVVLYLLLAPIAVLAPALGDGGRALFRLWSLRLLGATLAKLIYSVFLGVVLLMLRVLGDFGSLGWWTQWLLIASFWWIVFHHRHRLLEHVIHERGESTHRASLGSRLFAAHQAMRLASPALKRVGRAAKRVEEAGRRVPGPMIDRITKRVPSADRKAELAEQVSRTLERDHEQAKATVDGGPARAAELSALRDRRVVLRTEHQKATVAGDRRRAVSLALRAQRVGAQISAAEQGLFEARSTVRRGEENARQTGLVHDADQRQREADLFDREAELRPLLATKDDKRRGRRDYARLAPLAGLRNADYDGLPEPQRRRAQLEIDRALEQRRGWSRETRIADRERARLVRRKKAPAEQPPSRPQPVPVGRRRRQFDTHAHRPEPGPRRSDRQSPRDWLTDRQGPGGQAPDRPSPRGRTPGRSGSRPGGGGPRGPVPGRPDDADDPAGPARQTGPPPREPNRKRRGGR